MKLTSTERAGDARATLNPDHLARGHYAWTVRVQGTSGTTATQGGHLTVVR